MRLKHGNFYNQPTTNPRQIFQSKRRRVFSDNILFFAPLPDVLHRTRGLVAVLGPNHWLNVRYELLLLCCRQSFSPHQSCPICYHK